ncbi:NAD(P)H-hydrate dehydratase [Nanoarchaeota archaeon]
MKYPKRGKKSHKGDNGTVLLIGGSKDFVGAAFLAGMSAFRTGVDLVLCACPEKVAWSINCMSPDLITRKLKGSYLETKHVDKIDDLVAKADVVLIGNGISMKSAGFVKKLVKKLSLMGKKMVIDADAIKAIKLQDVKNAIITPHEKEFKILLKNSKLNSNNFVKKLGSNVLLLKSYEDKIYVNEKKGLKVYVNKTGNAGMSVGGTGDVLAGICAGLLAQTGNLKKSAKDGAKLTGKIGDVLFRIYRYGYTASDFIDEIPAMMR